MKRSRFTQEQMITAIKRHESGQKTADICRELGISQGTFYKWKTKYGGIVRIPVWQTTYATNFSSHLAGATIPSDR